MSHGTGGGQSTTGVQVVYIKKGTSPIYDVKSGQYLTAGQGIVNVGGGSRGGGTSYRTSTTPSGDSAAALQSLTQGIQQAQTPQIQAEVTQLQEQRAAQEVLGTTIDISKLPQLQVPNLVPYVGQLSESIIRSIPFSGFITPFIAPPPEVVAPKVSVPTYLKQIGSAGVSYIKENPFEVLGQAALGAGLTFLPAVFLPARTLATFATVSRAVAPTVIGTITAFEAARIIGASPEERPRIIGEDIVTFGAFGAGAGVGAKAAKKLLTGLEATALEKIYPEIKVSASKLKRFAGEPSIVETEVTAGKVFAGKTEIPFEAKGFDVSLYEAPISPTVRQEVLKGIIDVKLPTISKEFRSTTETIRRLSEESQAAITAARTEGRITFQESITVPKTPDLSQTYGIVTRDLKGVPAREFFVAGTKKVGEISQPFAELTGLKQVQTFESAALSIDRETLRRLTAESFAEKQIPDVRKLALERFRAREIASPSGEVTLRRVTSLVQEPVAKALPLVQQELKAIAFAQEAARIRTQFTGKGIEALPRIRISPFPTIAQPRVRATGFNVYYSDITIPSPRVTEAPTIREVVPRPSIQIPSLQPIISTTSFQASVSPILRTFQSPSFGQVLRPAFGTGQIPSVAQGLAQIQFQVPRLSFIQLAKQIPIQKQIPILKIATMKLPKFPTILKPPRVPFLGFPSLGRRQKAIRLKRLKGKKIKLKKKVPIPFADYLSVTETAARTGGFATQPKITRKAGFAYLKAIQRGQLRFPTVEQVKGFKR